MSRTDTSHRSRATSARLLTALGTALAAATASAQGVLISTEFNQDDQPGFDIWPVPITANFMSAQFGAIQVDVSTNTSFALPVNRGSVNGVPPGYSYQHLYEDLLHAFTPTGTLTMDFSGLQPNERYVFKLYAWDPGTPSGTHEWSVTGGTGVPAVQSVDWSLPLVDNDSFALVFDITTTAAGTFQIDNTAGLASSAVNGFQLSTATIGTRYCAPVATNSTGQAAWMSASGSSSVVANDLVLEASALPAQSFAFFLTSATQAFLANPGGSSGNLCLGGAIGRYVGPGQVQSSGVVGSVSLALDLGAHPTPSGLVAVAPGETWNFQCWYRDVTGLGAVTSNFSDGLEVTFN